MKTSGECFWTRHNAYSAVYKPYCVTNRMLFWVYSFPEVNDLFVVPECCVLFWLSIKHRNSTCTNKWMLLRRHHTGTLGQGHWTCPVAGCVGHIDWIVW